MKYQKTLLFLSLTTVFGLAGCGGSDNNEVVVPEDTTPVSTDTTAPVIGLNGNPSIDVVFDAVFNDLGAIATDDIDGTVTVSSQGNVDTRVPGTYEIIYTARDSAGNTSNATRTVIVAEDTSLSSTVTVPQGPQSRLFDGILVGADYWSEEAEILSAGMGFADIVAIDAPVLTVETVREAGGGWNQDVDCGTDTRNYTATSTQQMVSIGYIMQTPFGELKDGARGIDGLPIVFSWPIDTRTLSLTDFQFTLNTGDIVRPLAVSPFPNMEYNERNTMVVFGEFGNRLPSDHPDSRFPVRLDIVEDDTPLLMIGPNNQTFDAVGLSWETNSTPYDENNGPKLVGAKLNRIDGPMPGEGFGVPGSGVFPNDASVIFDEGDFMLRMLTSGGFSPDGQAGVKPTDFERFFRIHATGTDGGAIILDEVGVDYNVQGGTLRIVGISDLGQAEGGEVFFDACYDEDLDNYLDIILVGDEDAARSVTFLEIPSLEGGYSPFYSPGGPSRTPFDGVTYTQPGPADMEPVIIALDDPMRVTYNAPTEQPSGDFELLTLDVDGVSREYAITVPAAYDAGNNVPLLFNFHGLNGTAQGQFNDSELHLLAEQENFILATPQAIDGVWTATGFPISNGADDFAFVNALIDELSSTYRIDTSRVYATGMSLGGIFSFDLACNLSDRIAAVAPVSGVMTASLLQSCQPEGTMPILQTHGTDDTQISYENAENAIQWWGQFNQTAPEPEIIDLPDPFPGNGETVQRYVYTNSETGIRIEHLRINGGLHVWPGSAGDSDIDMANEVWRFVSQYDLNGLITD